MSGSKQINSNRHLGPEYQPKLSREFFSKVGSVFFYIYIFPFSCTLLLLASGQTYSAKSKKTMRKPLHIYNISELTRDRGISNLDSGWQDQKKKTRKKSKSNSQTFPFLTPLAANLQAGLYVFCFVDMFVCVLCSTYK